MFGVKNANKSRAKNYDPSQVTVEKGTIVDMSSYVPYSNTVMWYDYLGEGKAKINKTLFTFDSTPVANSKAMLVWLLETVIPSRLPKTEGKGIHVYMHANNGSRFDTQILKYDFLRGMNLEKHVKGCYKVLSPANCDVNGSPLSFDIRLIMYFGKEKKARKVTISFRDSFRITATKVSDIGTSFGVNVSKLPYPYAYYNSLFACDEKKYNVSYKPGIRSGLPEGVTSYKEFLLVCKDKPEHEDINEYWNTYTEANKFSKYTDIFEVFAADCRKLDTVETDTKVWWKDIGIDPSDLPLIEKSSDVERIRWSKKYTNREICGFKHKIKDRTGDKHVVDKKRMFTNKFILAMVRIQLGKFDKITSDPEAIRQLTEYREAMSMNIFMDYKKYCEVYNFFDCYNVIQGMCKFQECIHKMHTIKQSYKTPDDRTIDVDFKNVTRINIFQCRSISGVSWQIAVLTDCFRDVCKLSGGIARFIRSDIRGGRVYENKTRSYFRSSKYEKLEKYLNEEVTEKNLIKVGKLLTSPGGSQIALDLVGMYPSTALSKDAGIPTGRAHLIQSVDQIKLLRKCKLPYWVVCSWETKYDNEIPESCRKDDKDKNQWANGKFVNQVIDDVKMNYMIESGELTFEDFKFDTTEGVPLGVSFNGMNYMICGVWQSLIDERTRVRKLNPGYGNVLKLVANNIYGRSILKEKTSTLKYRLYADHKKYLSKNLHKLDGEIVTCGNYIEVKEFTNPEDHAIYPHFGNRVLSISKTTIGKYIAASHTNNRTDNTPSTITDLRTIYDNAVVGGEIRPLISYTDTDSMHTLVDVLPNVAPFLSRRLGDMHSDFDFKAKDGITPLIIDVSTAMQKRGMSPSWMIRNMELSAIEGVYCSPKSYAERVFGIDPLTNRYRVMEHVRLKGISKGSPTFADLMRIHNGEPVRFIERLAGDSTVMKVVHHRGFGICSPNYHMIKEIMPEKVNSVAHKYYYAEGNGIISGYYQYDEMPYTDDTHAMRINFAACRLDFKSNNAVNYYHIQDGVMSKVGNEFTDLHNMLDLKPHQVFRYGSGIRCGIYHKDTTPIRVTRLIPSRVDELFMEFDGEKTTALQFTYHGEVAAV